MSVAYPANQRSDAIDSLVRGVDRYNPQNCHVLEEYLTEQLISGTYDPLANMALLKLYQFNLTLTHTESCLAILLLNLCHAPFSADFDLSWSLMSDSFAVGGCLPPTAQPDPEESDGDDPARVPRGEKDTAEFLRSVSELLSARRFSAAWDALKPDIADTTWGVSVREQMTSLSHKFEGFAAILRQAISADISRSYSTIRKDTLRRYLGLQDETSLEQSVAALGWTRDGNVFKSPPNPINCPQPILAKERIQISQLANLLAA